MKNVSDDEIDSQVASGRWKYLKQMFIFCKEENAPPPDSVVAPKKLLVNHHSKFFLQSKINFYKLLISDEERSLQCLLF